MSYLAKRLMAKTKYVHPLDGRFKWKGLVCWQMSPVDRDSYLVSNIYNTSVPHLFQFFRSVLPLHLNSPEINLLNGKKPHICSHLHKNEIQLSDDSPPS